MGNRRAPDLKRGRALRAQRERQQLTREQLAARADVAVSTLLAMETKGWIPRRPTLRRICEALGLGDVWPEIAATQRRRRATHETCDPRTPPRP